MLQIPKSETEKAKEKSNPIPAAGSIVRHSGKIKIKNMGSPVLSAGKTSVKAKLSIEGHDYGEVEFQGTRKDSKILLEPLNPELHENLKATAYCISEDCDQYFVDVFYKENEVYYHDQFQTAQAPAKVEEPVVKEKTPVQNTPTAPKTKEPQPPKNPKAPPVKETPAPKETPKPLRPEVVDDLNSIPDDIPVEDPSEQTGYVGTNDDEAKALFEPAKPPEKAKEKTPTPAPPVKNNPGKGNTPAPKQPAPTPTPKEEKEPVTNKNFPWEIRKDQASGSSGAGRLKNPTDFFQLTKLPDVFFSIPRPDRTQFFGVLDLAQALQKMGEFLQTVLPGRKLAINDISKKFGGHLSPHRAHQNGTEADIRYLVRSDENVPSYVVSRGKVTNQFLVADQWKLFKKAFDLKQVEVIFVDIAVKRAMCDEAKRTQDLKTRTDQEGSTAEILKRLYPVSGHDTHFHVKVKCDHELCRSQPYLKLPQTGC